MFNRNRTVTKAALDAANTLYNLRQCEAWRISEQTLDWLRDALPNWDLNSVLVKAAALNTLYSTRNWQVIKAADRIVGIMNEKPTDYVEIAVRISNLEEANQKQVSFASKFTHFFVDNGMPMYDQWAEKGLRRHLGRLTWAEPRLRAWVDLIRRLRCRDQLEVPVRELDRYLWLSGMRSEWDRAQKTGQKVDRLGISKDMAGLFRSPDLEVKGLLKTLVGEDPE